jgi:hypothetical protein
MTELAAYADRLERAARRLRAGDLAPEQAAALVEESAALATEAAEALDRRVRASAQEPLPGQDALL